MECVVLLREAAAIGVVPCVVFEVEGDLSDVVAVIVKLGADGVALVERVAFP